MELRRNRASPAFLTATLRSLHVKGPGGGALGTAVMLVVMLVVLSVKTSEFALPSGGLLALTIAAWLPLIFRRRWPLEVLVASAFVEATHLAVVSYNSDLGTEASFGLYQPVPLATATAAFTLALLAPKRTAWAGGFIAASALIGVAAFKNPGELLGPNLAMLNVVLGATALGSYVASRRLQAQELIVARRAEVAEQVTLERMRIARDLHDILAHNLTIVNAQAGVAAHLLDTDPVAARSALSGIERHSRQALDEVRATVGLLRSPEDDRDAHAVAGAYAPTPSLADVSELVRSFAAAGAVVDLSVTGEPHEVSAPTDLAAFRIIQESLTNATKHATGSSVQVGIAFSPDSLAVTVSNPLTHSAAANSASRNANGSRTEHGIIGMGERARAVDGELTISSIGGSFVVHAVLPTGRVTA